MRYKIVLVVLIIILFGFGAYAARIESISDAILSLREKAEVGISYFIAGDYTNSVNSLISAIDFANEILEALSNEIGYYMNVSKEVEVVKFEPSKSELITSVRRYTTEAVKAYIVGKIDVVLERIIAIKNILTMVLNKAYEFTVKFDSLKIVSNFNLEREVLSEVRKLSDKVYSTQINVVSITNFVVGTNFVVETNVIVDRESFLSSGYIWYVIGGVSFVIIVFVLTLLRYRFIRKRIDDLSDLL